MVKVNDYISYKVYPKGVESSVVLNDIKTSGITSIYPVSKPNVKLLNGFIKKIGSLPKECNFTTHFVIYFIDYQKAPITIPAIEI